MVVPIPKTEVQVRLNDVKSYVGNHLNLKLSQNFVTIFVVGNQCKLKIVENFGAVKVTGNHCEIEVSHGAGSVEYTGNSGTIFVGPGVDTSKITYMGSNGRIVSKLSKGTASKGPSKSSSYPEFCVIPKRVEHLLRNLSINGRIKADNAYIVQNNIKLQNGGRTSIDVKFLDFYNMLMLIRYKKSRVPVFKLK